MKKIRLPVPTKQPMHEIDVRTSLETVEAQLKQARTGEEIRRLNSKKRTLEKKLAKVYKRDTRENGSHHPSEKVRST